MPVITRSVGKGGTNRSEDIQTIQELLNANLHLLIPLAPLRVNGMIDDALVFAIEEYQRRVLHMRYPDGKMDPKGRTLRSLSSDPADLPWIDTGTSETLDWSKYPTTPVNGITTPLPRAGVGFKSYKPQETQYGYEKTVNFIQSLGVAWAKRNPAPRLLIGDLSIKGGGPTPKQWGKPEKGYHKSHGSGVDFDVQIIRSDNVEDPRSVTIGEPAPAGRYDRERTQVLVDLIREIAGKDFKLILSADAKLNGIHYEGTHRRHLHVRLNKD
jgi:hypothetical protein